MAKKQNANQKEKIAAPRSNDELYGNYDVRVLYLTEDGENSNKICRLREAKEMAYEMGLDLVEINPKSNPPVMRICDFSKYMYDLKKQAKAKKQNKVELKEIPLSVNISMHDLEIKAKKAREFILKGDKVKVTLMMKKRELLRREENKKSILEFIMLLTDVATPESMPKDEGNRTIVILKKKNSNVKD